MRRGPPPRMRRRGGAPGGAGPAVGGVRRGACGSEARGERRAAGALTHERASIEDIMLYYIKGDAK